MCLIVLLVFWCGLYWCEFGLGMIEHKRWCVCVKPYELLFSHSNDTYNYCMIHYEIKVLYCIYCIATSSRAAATI